MRGLAYYCRMAQKRRVYIITKSHDVPEQDVYSSMSKVADNLDADISYRALIARLHRAKNLKGEQRIRLKDNNGENITIEVREIE